MKIAELQSACLKKQAELEEKYYKLFLNRTHNGAVHRNIIKKEYVTLSLIIELSSFVSKDKELIEDDSLTALRMLLKDKSIQ